MNAVAELLNRLNLLGIQLYLEQGELRFKAPKGAMTADLMARLKANKIELTVLLKKITVNQPALVEPLSQYATSKVIPLSFAQQRLWFLFKLEGASPVYNILMASRLTGHLDVEKLRRSFDYLISRHESLRTTFGENNQGLAQQTIHDSIDLEMIVDDLSTYLDNQKQSLLNQAKSQMADTRFELNQAPLSKVMLIRYDDDEWVLLMAMHHIIGDGWSMGILSRELAAAYQSYTDHAEPELEPVTINYRDYSVWQQRQQQTILIEQGLKRWCQLLENSEYQLDLKAGKSRPELRSDQGSTCPVLIEPLLSHQLQRLAESKGVSLFVLLLTVYFILLQRYSGRKDLLVGTQVANRNEPNLEPIVGFFINTIPLRARIETDLRVTDLLEQVNDFCLSGFDLQHVPFDRLVQEIKPERDFGSNPLVQIMFLWQNAPIKNLELKGLTMQREPLNSQAAKFDLTLELGMEQSCIQGVFEYSTDLYDAWTIVNMVGQYTHLLQAIVHNPDSVVCELQLQKTTNNPLVENELIQNKLFENERAHVSNDHQQNIISAFNAQVLKTPNAKALNDGQQILTYQQLSEQADVIASRLCLAGVNPGSVVAIYLSRANHYLVAIMGVLKAGCCYLPLELTLPIARVKFILKDASVAAVISEQLEFADYVHIQCNDLDQVIKPTQLSIPAQLPAYLIYTSGSTGLPKGVLISHQSILGLIQSLNSEVYQHQPQALNIALMASFVFDASVQQIFAALLQGHCLHICDQESRRDGTALLAFLQKQDIDLSDCTPSLLQIMLAAGLVDEQNLRLRQLIVGGEALPPQLVEIIARSSQADYLQIYNVYGPTECTVDATIHPINNRCNYQGSAVSIGQSLGHAQLTIVDCFGYQQPDGLTGEIYISGNALAQGYWQQPRLTAERFVPAEQGQRYYRTGDQGRVNQHGEIEFLGRLDDQVKICGYRIELGEIEAQLLQCSGVLQAVARLNKGEPAEIIAYLVVQKQLSVASMRAALTIQLPDYMIPAHFVVLDQLPLNPAGKIDRKALPEFSETKRLSDDLGGAPQGEREQLLAEVWCAVLGLDSLGRNDNYFASGGDSIKALQIVSRIRQKGWKLEVRDLFTHATVSKLAPKLALMNEEPVINTERPQGAVALSPIQQHFFRHHGSHYHHFNQAFLLTAHDVDVERLKKALTRVCDQHDAFRLRFKLDGDQWTQAYAETDCFEFTIQPLTSLQDLSLHAANIQQSFDLKTGVLFKIVYYQLPEKSYLLLIAHHLIIDAVSWRILMEDLNEAYQQGEHWQVPIPTLSMKGWMQYCQQHSQQIIEEQQSYWQQLIITPSIEVDDTHYSDLNIIKIELDTALSELFLTGVHQTYSTEANDLLLSALLLAYHQWTQKRTLSLILEGHGRDVFDGIDVNRTIGWFTTRYPVMLRYERDHDLGYLIKSVKESLRAIPNKGVGYGILRYMNPADEVQVFKDPTISFNYLGQFGEQQQGHFAISNESIGDIISPEAKPPYLIEFVGKHVAGQLSFEIAYSRKAHQIQHIVDYAEEFKESLAQIITHAANAEAQSLTPSDIDYDGFDVNELDDFMAQL